MNRRVHMNQALAYAAQLANERDLPLLVYEGLTCTYPFANDRMHTFILEGAPDTAERLREFGAGYVFHLRRRVEDRNNALYTLARQAACVVTDDYPTFIARQHNERVPAKLDVPYFVVDASCVVPMNLLEKREYAAYTIRPKIRRLLPQHLRPMAPVELRRRMDPAMEDELRAGLHVEVTECNIAALAASCEIDHHVAPSLAYRGGARAAEARLAAFLTRNLKRYAEGRNEPSAHATSNLSPYLHFGQISSLEVALCARGAAAEQEVDPEVFLEELIVRRELAFNYARFVNEADCLNNLPDWAKATLRKHASDPRSPSYTREQFEAAATHDELWNAAQTEMLLRGKIHGYYRMYWGKKIIEWSPTCQHALETMVYLHDRYALDGRDPATYTNILWCFGLHDRPWTERPVFGQIRWMSYDGMRRKTNSAAYVREMEHLKRTGQDPFTIVA
jgi:deoxyribodipyrimidine photo-lyase